jgi:hypothetical protein
MLFAIGSAVSCHLEAIRPDALVPRAFATVGLGNEVLLSDG